ncbi:hypothetical protein GJ744_006827 [Endocarpon pusillum]|uniref:Uncharacterized protein n=1 Tax=Endocarpon pusillum TaxID=364733 RepID=A0A8H7ANI1_9EURO|nr:hypothetical protein GJ744_006827 [Endocarpon pusillum]
MDFQPANGTASSPERPASDGIVDECVNEKFERDRNQWRFYLSDGTYKPPAKGDGYFRSIITANFHPSHLSMTQR